MLKIADKTSFFSLTFLILYKNILDSEYPTVINKNSAELEVLVSRS